MAATYLNLQNWFARAIGENDYTSLDATHKALINDKLKEISSRYPFKCNKKSTSVSISSNVGNLPTDFDYSHSHNIKVYSYSSTEKYTYYEVPFDDVTSYPTSSYVYALDNENTRIKTNQTSATVTLDYFSIPEDLTNTTDTTKFPIPKAISLEAAGDYWEIFEEEEDKAKILYLKADSLINQAISKENLNKEPRKLSSILDSELSDAPSSLATKR